jgi:hypothetical protein
MARVSSNLTDQQERNANYLPAINTKILEDLKSTSTVFL